MGLAGSQERNRRYVLDVARAYCVDRFRGRRNGIHRFAYEYELCSGRDECYLRAAREGTSDCIPQRRIEHCVPPLWALPGNHGAAAESGGVQGNPGLGERGPGLVLRETGRRRPGQRLPLAVPAAGYFATQLRPLDRRVQPRPLPVDHQAPGVPHHRPGAGQRHGVRVPGPPGGQGRQRRKGCRTR